MELKWFRLLQSVVAHLLPHVLQMGMFTNESAERSRSCAGINRFFDDVRLASYPHPAVLSLSLSVSLFLSIPWNMFIFSFSSHLLIFLQRVGQIPVSLTCFPARSLWGDAALGPPLCLNRKLPGYV